ncbi:SH3-like domain-containing protein [Legionella longbeachae]|uniref:Putative thiocyanate hydrolase alpha subunit n=1 Tax=Legionella longbeachae serogroup 1 (strain NSW150) TaxID=661367 RepID=D3HTN9_LEGLN|nr:SH3-like domain-containing protein [Legionella longbeachae]VEE02795.1 thiocyanate hydrolase subunit alpha [Legionella oakridgensis]HBD7397976.1 nitrile hydratase subunit beta [Legionella pneumophila]ARB90955.1 nitrile hydratase subunit beta [Legionella longbeachae]ARM32618.1 nitrile hydratase subunit beta [Legionella longbeachae]QEY51805.1 nitrile hydratase subunit beta [Legionella longbeachae]
MSTKFKMGNKIRVIDLPSLFHTLMQGYTRGKIGEVVMIRSSWVITEDEAWGRYEGRREPFYMVRFKMTDLWAGYGGPAINSLDTELSERWIEHI